MSLSFSLFFLQVVGLGNYTLPNTRHSVGMLVVDCLSQQLGASWQFNRRSLGHVAVTKVNNRQLIMQKHFKDRCVLTDNNDIIIIIKL